MFESITGHSYELSKQNLVKLLMLTQEHKIPFLLSLVTALVIDLAGFLQSMASAGTNIKYVTGGVITGFPNQIMSELEERLRRYSQTASVEYIGIASGDDGESAMRSRYDDNKRKLGINEMRLLYKSSSHDNVQRVERELIDYRVGSRINRNETGGGGGLPPDNPKHYFVYVAYKR